MGEVFQITSRMRGLSTSLMRKNFITSIPYSPCLRMLEGCFNMRELKQIHAYAITHDLVRFDSVIGGLLAFCARSEYGDLHYAETLFNQMLMPNVFDCNSMIMAFSRNSEFPKSLSIFNGMRNKIGIHPDIHTFIMMFKTSTSLSLLEQLHTQTIKFGNLSTCDVVNSMVYGYSKHGAIGVARRVFDERSHENVACWNNLISVYCFNGLVDEARNLFDKIPHKNEVSYSAMVTGYVNNCFFKEGINLFIEFHRSKNLKPNKELLQSVLTACAAIGIVKVKEGKWIHSLIDEYGFEYEFGIGSALINFYARCGYVETAEHIFRNLSYKIVSDWTAMIRGLENDGQSQKALDLFAKMEKNGPKPDAETLVVVLQACRNEFLLNAAWQLFGRMIKVYDIPPDWRHYGCMVDILTRAGQYIAIVVLTWSMPEVAKWGIMLERCLIDGDIPIGLRIVKLLIKLEPDCCGSYELSKIQANMGMQSFRTVGERILKFLANDADYRLFFKHYKKETFIF